MNRLAVTAVPLDIRNIVWPSGSARATVSAATTPPAPGRFSIVTGWPSDWLSSAATMRAVRSPAPPAANGTTMRKAANRRRVLWLKLAVNTLIMHPILSAIYQTHRQAY